MSQLPGGREGSPNCSSSMMGRLGKTSKEGGAAAGDREQETGELSPHPGSREYTHRPYILD